MGRELFFPSTTFAKKKKKKRRYDVWSTVLFFLSFSQKEEQLNVSSAFSFFSS